MTYGVRSDNGRVMVGEVALAQHPNCPAVVYLSGDRGKVVLDRSPEWLDEYRRAFCHVFGLQKALVWHEGRMQVQVETGERHQAAELGHGERQVLDLVVELRRRWTPGSLVLLDDLDMHLHPHRQTRLWEFILLLQRERGGQVIATTHSSHLFRVVEPGCKVLLGQEIEVLE